MFMVFLASRSIRLQPLSNAGKNLSNHHHPVSHTIPSHSPTKPNPKQKTDTNFLILTPKARIKRHHKKPSARLYARLSSDATTHHRVGLPRIGIHRFQSRCKFQHPPAPYPLNLPVSSSLPLRWSITFTYTYVVFINAKVEPRRGFHRANG